MAERYLTLKVTLQHIDGARFRSRIDSSPRGASRGAGWDFVVGDDLVAENATFTERMSRAALGPDEVREMGKKLFALIFQDTVLRKYEQCVAMADGTRNLRIGLNVLDDRLIPFPWEYLHDENGALLTAGHSIVRVIDELAEKRAPFGPIQRLLVAIANPTDEDWDSFDDEVYKREIEQSIADIPGLEPKFIMRASSDRIEQELRDEKYDAFYFIGHGRFSESLEGQLICEGENRKAVPMPASRLAQVLRDAQSVRFVYLGSCSSGKTSSRQNQFAGVAQRLLRDGDVAAVVAMQTEIGQKAAIAIAKGFFRALRRGESPERAMNSSRSKAQDGHSWGIPVVYTYLAGPEEFDSNRIACLLNSGSDDRFALLLPSFVLGGLVGGDVSATEIVKANFKPLPKTLTYRGSTFAETDVLAAWEIARLLSRIARPETTRWFEAHEPLSEKFSHWFLFGSRSNERLASVIKGFKPKIRFTYGKKWCLHDLGTKRVFCIDDPSKSNHYAKHDDFGAIEKIRVPQIETTFFLISGLGDRATQGCAEYLSAKWEKLLEDHGASDFRVLLWFRAGLPSNMAEDVSDSPAPEISSR